MKPLTEENVHWALLTPHYKDSFLMEEQFDYKRSQMLQTEVLTMQLQADAVEQVVKLASARHDRAWAIKSLEAVNNLNDGSGGPIGYLREIERCLEFYDHPLYVKGRGSWALETIH